MPRVRPLPAPGGARHDLDHTVHRAYAVDPMLEPVEAEVEPVHERAFPMRLAQAAFEQQANAVVVGRRPPQLQLRTCFEDFDPVECQ